MPATRQRRQDLSAPARPARRTEHQGSRMSLTSARSRTIDRAMSAHDPDRDPSWGWAEPRWRRAVEKVRAGRSLHPARWKDGARVCVALSFDSDHETSTLREGSVSPGRLSQGQYGSRAAVPRILEILRRHEIRASFFVPGVV